MAKDRLVRVGNNLTAFRVGFRLCALTMCRRSMRTAFNRLLVVSLAANGHFLERTADPLSH